MARQRLQQHNESLYVKTSATKAPDYLPLAIADLFDLGKCSAQNRTEMQSNITDLGLDELHYHNELSQFRVLWDSLRKSTLGNSIEFMQMELIKKPYPFSHPGKKKTMYCTKLTKEQLSEIAEGVKIDVGGIVAMAQTFGAKKVHDNNLKAKTGTTIRPLVYEMLTKEIENFNKFIHLERLNLTLKTAEFYVWDEQKCLIHY